MGITTNEYFEYIYRVIFNPKSFFADENLTKSTRLAIANIVLISAVLRIISGINNLSVKEISFVFLLFFSVIGAIIAWFLTALFFEYTAKIFGREGNLNAMLYYSSFALIPYIFFAPVSLIKSLGDVGYALSIYSSIFIYFWVIYLYALAINAAYKISLSRSFMLILLPIISSFIAIYWAIGFFTKVWYTFSI